MQNELFAPRQGLVRAEALARPSKLVANTMIARSPDSARTASRAFEEGQAHDQFSYAIVSMYLRCITSEDQDLSSDPLFEQLFSQQGEKQVINMSN